jgi:hypothetical protein
MSESGDTRMFDALRRDREAEAPKDARMRVASRLGLVAPFSKPPLHLRGRAASRALGVHTIVISAATFIAGGVLGALLHAKVASVPVHHVVAVDRPAVPIPVVASTTPATPPSRPALSSTVDSRSQAAPLPTTTVAPVPHVRQAQLDAEREVLDIARAALVSGDFDDALSALGRHANTFAHPLLGEEREALAVQALVRAGRYEEARSRAEAFRRKSPNSLLLPAVDAALVSIR